MVEIIRTNDMVELSWAKAILQEQGIGYLVLDEHTSSIEGSIGAIPRRLMVLDEDACAANRILNAARNADIG